MSLHQNKKLKGDGSFHDVIPLYYKVYDFIRKQIERGDYPVDVPLPGEHELAARFEVSRVTIRRTMGMLEEAGMITRLRGRGTFVNPDAIARTSAENYSGFDQNIKDFEAATTVERIRTESTRLPAWGRESVKDAFPEDDVLEIEYTRSGSSGPFSHIRTYVPRRVAEQLNLDELGNKTVTTAIEEIGTIVVEIDQKLTAIAADEVEARALRLSLREPLIRVRRVMYDRDGFPVQFVEAIYNPAYFEYHVSLSRENTAGEAPRWVPTGR